MRSSAEKTIVHHYPGCAGVGGNEQAVCLFVGCLTSQ